MEYVKGTNLEVKCKELIKDNDRCLWKLDKYMIAKKIRFTTSCGEHWFVNTQQLLPFNICPFCNKLILKE